MGGKVVPGLSAREKIPKKHRIKFGCLKTMFTFAAALENKRGSKQRLMVVAANKTGSEMLVKVATDKASGL